jgi:hypothetical protein
VQQEERGDEMLPEAWIRARGPFRTSASKSSGGAWRRSVTGSTHGALGHLDPTARLVAVLCVTGVREVRESPVAWNCRGGATHRRRRLGRNSGACEVETEESGLGVDPGHETGLLRRLWWDVAQQGSWPTVEQGHGVVEVSRQWR